MDAVPGAGAIQRLESLHAFVFRGIRQGGARTGIRVTAVCPAGVATDLYGLTPYWQRIGCKLGVLITPDSCARRGLKALWRGRRCIVPDWWNRAWIPFCKVLPMWVLRPVRRFTMKFQK